ncbi:MAG TPA: PEP-CTERM sorting domain-containing protein [Bryobacteraceae bacterium]|nr:PEP-CTERM sorting domain-containing protein [Bryobacteraceae bacterium]
MRLLQALPLIASLAAGSAMASTFTLDYISPFTSSSGLSALSYQAGQVVTVPDGYLHLQSFSLIAFDGNGADLKGEVQIWNGSDVGTTLYTSDPIGPSGSASSGVGSYRIFTFTPDTPIAVTSDTQIYLSLIPATDSIPSGNVGYLGSQYSGGYVVFNVGSGLQTNFSPSDMAFAATFDNNPETPEPSTMAMFVGSGLLLFLAKRKFASQS